MSKKKKNSFDYNLCAHACAMSMYRSKITI
jgi:hypothetical protein